jgi:hypothetical protein
MLLQENGPGIYRYQANCPTAGSTISVITTLIEQWYEVPENILTTREFNSVNLALTYLNSERCIIAS